MRIVKILSVGVLVTILVGCAAHPGDIAPQAIPTSQFQGLSCAELDTELANARNNLEAASDRQKKKRTMDGVGNVLLIPGLMSLAKDSKEAVARHKGEIQAQIRAIDRKCSEG